LIQFSALDRVFSAFDNALKTLTTDPSGTGRPMPGQALPEASMDAAARRHAAGLMRVNHAGEVAAQGLYQGQALATASPQQAHVLLAAAREESDHLRWTRRRLQALDSRPSVLSPLWYAGAFCLGLVAGRLPAAQGMGFVSETERQVEAHLKGHLSALPPDDARSRAVVAQMMVDEAQHGAHAREMGGADLPQPVQLAMKASAKLMIHTAYRL
jgi:ubiquinone biosynthesis monooxygenase Coq7